MSGMNIMRRLFVMYARRHRVSTNSRMVPPPTGCVRLPVKARSMPRQSMGQLTVLLNRVHAGDSMARDALFAAAYTELHRLAQARLRAGGRNAVLDTTCLVHESYLRFVSVGELHPEDRRTFFGYASRVMRSVIVDMIRERLAKKRGGD